MSFRFAVFYLEKTIPNPKDQLPDGWGAERFKILDGGAGRIGFKGWNGQCLGPMIFRVQPLTTFSFHRECFVW